MKSLIYKNFLRRFSEFLEDSVTNFFKQKTFSGIDKALLEYATSAVLSKGKRIRPYLAYLAANWRNKRTYLSPRILRLGVALEAIHAALLVQDDIVDRSKLRRGDKTVYIKFREYLQKELSEAENIPVEFLSDNLAVLVSDLLFNLAYHNLLDLSPEVGHLVISHINNTIKGQALDILNSYDLQKSQDILRHVFTVYEYKTAYYTFVMPLQAGFSVMGKRFPKRLKYFGIKLGIAYQIQDDIIGAFGDPRQTGKDNISDFKEGKMTILIAYALQKLDNASKQRLLQLLGKEDMTEGEADEIRELLLKADALNYAKNKAKELINQALDDLELLKGRDKIKAELEFLANWVVERLY